MERPPNSRDVPARGGRERPGIVVHRGSLAPGEARRRDRIPVTSPGRTITDLADQGNRRALERAIDEADYLRLDLRSLEPLPGRRGSRLLAEVLARHAPGSTRTRSHLEELLLATCRRHGLPAPLVNARVAGYEVDFVWRSQRLIVEADGWASHGTRRGFETDRARDAELAVAGWRVIRVSWRRIEADSQGVTAQLVALLRS